MTENCLHCKISELIVEHYRAEQGAEGAPVVNLGELGRQMVHVMADIFSHIANDPSRLRANVSVFALAVIDHATASRERMGAATHRHDGASLQ